MPILCLGNLPLVLEWGIYTVHFVYRIRLSSFHWVLYRHLAQLPYSHNCTHCHNYNYYRIVKICHNCTHRSVMLQDCHNSAIIIITQNCTERLHFSGYCNVTACRVILIIVLRPQNRTPVCIPKSATFTFRPRVKQWGLCWLVSWPWHYEGYQMKAKEIS